MVCRRNGSLLRSALSALAVLAAALAPTLVARPALASPTGAADTSVASTKDDAAKKPEAKHAKKGAAHVVKGQKPHAKADGKTEAKPKRVASLSPKDRHAKKTASRAPAPKKKAAVVKKADSDAPERPCAAAPVTVSRGGLEERSMALVDCHGAPLAAARDALSVLARPLGMARPDEGARSHGKAAAVRLLDAGLLTRLGATARRFPGRSITIVNGTKTGRGGSQHEGARALDFSVDGVTNEELIAFCKTLPDTGCGYYPNSPFVHLDVRNPGSGTASWIDASEPGQPPRYVTKWPPSRPSQDAERAAPKAVDEDGHDGPRTRGDRGPGGRSPVVEPSRRPSCDAAEGEPSGASVTEARRAGSASPLARRSL